MLGVNKVILIGNLGRDPELRFTPAGQPVASFSVATTEKWGKGDDRQEKTEWHNIVAWGKLAEPCNKYLKKGRSAYIEGKITNRSWDDKDGNKRNKTEIVASQVQFLGSTGQGDQGRTELVADNPFSNESPAPVGGGKLSNDDLPF